MFLIIFPESSEKTVSRRRLKSFSSVAFYPCLQYFITEHISSDVFSKSRLSISGVGSKIQFKIEPLSASCERVGGRSLSFRCMFVCVCIIYMRVCKHSGTQMHKLNAFCFWAQDLCKINICSVTFPHLVSCHSSFWKGGAQRFCLKLKWGFFLIGRKINWHACIQRAVVDEVLTQCWEENPPTAKGGLMEK